MAGGSINWYVVVPDATRNLVSNPSFEFGTAGWAGTGSPTLGTAADDQQVGAWAAHITGAAGTVGIRAPITGAVAGGTYTASAYVRMRGTSGGQARISLGGTSFTAAVGTDDGWTRIAVGSVGAVGSVAVQRASGAAGTLWVDGVQVEAAPGGLSSLTTYIDGDQAGGTWEGAPHASPSYRGGQARSGGTLVPLAALGFRPQETPDTGMWPVTNILQSYAVNAGAEYQRARPTERTFTLMATFTGTTLADQHVTRREVIDALKVERVTPAQPNRLYYTGATGTTYIDAYYDSGLGWGGANVIADEDAAVRFVAADPAWYGVAQEGTSLAPYTVIGSAVNAMYRDPEGRWGTMTTGVVGTVNAVAIDQSGTVYMGGTFNVAGGTTGARNIAYWAGGAWGTLGAGSVHIATPPATEIAGVMDILPYNGTVFVAGNGLRSVGGTHSLGVGFWTPAGWGTLTNGTLSGGAGGGSVAYALGVDLTGQVIVGGDFLAAGGTVAPGIAAWGGAWGTLTNGTISGGGTNVHTLLVDLGGTIMVGGEFSSAGGTATGGGVAYWAGGTWGTFGATVGTVVALAQAANQARYMITGNTFPSASARPSLIRSGMVGTIPALGVITSFGANTTAIKAQPNGDLIIGGNINTINGGYVPTFGLTVYNGFSALPPDVRVNTGGAAYDVEVAPTGTWYVGGAFFGMGTAASVTPVVNSGIAEGYPTLRLRYTAASGTARIFQLLNTTTGDSLYFNFAMLPGEIATLVTTPGNRSFTSNLRGNIFGYIVTGSNIASWRLLPGTNQISFFADNPSVQADLFWNPRHASIDGGAQAVI